MDRNLALEFVRVTEAAAIAASHWLGRGDKEAADKAAVEAMRSRLNDIEFRGTIVIGEGEKDEAPMLYIGEKVGRQPFDNQVLPEFDIAVDPLEGTTLTAHGKPGAIAVIAFGTKGTFLDPPGTYMDQLTVGPEGKGLIDITAPLEENIKKVAQASGKEPEEMTIAILERDRNQHYVDSARRIGSRVILFEHGTVAHGIAPAISNWEIDMMIGIGGAPEAVITAAGIKALGGDMQAILKPHSDEFLKQAQAKGMGDLNRVYKLNDLARDQTLFVATGVSASPILNGVNFGKNYITTHSIMMRSKSGTVRFIEAHHKISD
ncbi:MAG: class II fructose-bisphosphatase [Patescibacteria group bacterium]